MSQLKNVISVTPCKDNIRFATVSFKNYEDILEPVANKLKKETIHCTRMIIYCRTYDTYGAYIYFQRKLGSSWTYPTDTPDLPRFRLVDMFMSCTDPEYY